MNVITVMNIMKFNLLMYVKIWINENQKCEEVRFAEHHKAQLADHKAFR